jgi:hypothetical protein
MRAFSRTPAGSQSEDSVAQFHMSVKAIGWSAGRSATAAAYRSAYRSVERIVDERTGEIHDCTHKRGVMDSALMLPGGEMWRAVEQHRKRGDAVLACEFTLALPHELPADERARLAFDYGRELAERYGVAVDVCLHEPDREGALAARPSFTRCSPSSRRGFMWVIPGHRFNQKAAMRGSRFFVAASLKPAADKSVRA